MDNRQANSSGASSSGTSRFVPNTIALIVQTILATLITLAQIKILANYLPKDTFGLFASLRGFSLLLSTVAANGIPLLLVRFIPVFETNRNSRDAVRLVLTCIVGATALLILVSLMTQLFGKWTWRFADTGALGFDLYFWFYATTLGVMLKLILYGGLNGLRRLTVQVVLETASLAATLAAIVVLRDSLTLTLLFRILGIVHLVTVVVGLLVFFTYLRGQTGGRGPDDRRARTDSYMSYYGGAVGLSLVALAFTDVDRYLLAQVISLELLALFHVGARISRLANRVLGVANLAFQPEVTRLDTEGRDASVLRSTWIFLKFNTTMAVLMTMAVVVFAGEIITIVSSHLYLDAVPLLVLLAASLPLTTMTAPLTTVMKARDQAREALVCDLSWAFVYVLLIVWLSPKIGLIGVGLAQVLACMAQLLLALRLSNLPVKLRSVGLLASRLAVAVIAFVPPVLFGIFFDGGSSVSVGGKIVFFLVGCIVYRLLLDKLRVFDIDERSMLKDLLERRRLGFVSRLVGVK
ncbi:MAG: lipopolysaccharide biosynthesis protein [Candidatus Latescibacterota bacterium]|nr:MAG: lipopolysaccharide biosynthesis protein [Candidatus Latescibacterota bacterium]